VKPWRWILTSEELIAELTALAHPLRMRVIAELSAGRVHVSELARRLGMSTSWRRRDSLPGT
jgi:DNA-binding transcriptional ArsR family regulator